MSPLLTIIISFLILLVLFFVIWLFIYNIYNCFYIKVKSCSPLYKELQQLNNRYEKIFNNQIEDKLMHNKYCGSTREFHSRNLNVVFQDYIEGKLDTLVSLIEKIEENKISYETYLQEYEACYHLTKKSEIKGSRTPYRIFIAIENKLYAKNKLIPILNLIISVVVSYTSPAGRNHYEDIRNYDLKEIKYWISEVKKKIEYRSTQAYLRKIERSKVTNSLRWDIFKSDNFKCRMCNASSDEGAKLHIDHIIPVSKGGTSEIDNLQTLCEACNLGKSDKYDF